MMPSRTAAAAVVAVAALVALVVPAVGLQGPISLPFGPEFINDDGRPWSFTRTDNGIAPAGVVGPTRPFLAGINVPGKTNLEVGPAAPGADQPYGGVIYSIDLSQPRVSLLTGPVAAGDMVHAQVDVSMSCPQHASHELPGDCDPYLMFSDGTDMVGISVGDNNWWTTLATLSPLGDRMTGHSHPTRGNDVPIPEFNVDGMELGLEIMFASGVPGVQLNLVRASDGGSILSWQELAVTLDVHTGSGALHFHVVGDNDYEAYSFGNMAVRTVAVLPGLEDPCAGCDAACNTCAGGLCAPIVPAPEGCPGYVDPCVAAACDPACTSGCAAGICIPTVPAPEGCPGYVPPARDCGPQLLPAEAVYDATSGVFLTTIAPSPDATPDRRLNGVDYFELPPDEYLASADECGGGRVDNVVE